MNDRQIYILSIFDPTNYGNRLQACALEAAVASLTGKEVLSVDCRRPVSKRGVFKIMADLNRVRIESKKAPPRGGGVSEFFRMSTVRLSLRLPRGTFVASLVPS